MNRIDKKEIRIFRVVISIDEDIIKTGKDPLELLYKLDSIGDIVETNTDVSNLPSLNEINVDKFFLSTTILLRTEASLNQVQDIFKFIKDNSEIKIIEYDEDYLTRLNENIMENRLGEVLVQKGLIAEEEIKQALGAQKKLGEILVEKGLVTEEEIKQALGAQKKLGEILVEKGKVMPSKIESILEQQNEVRKFKESNTVRVDIDKIDKLLNSIEKLTTLENNVTNMLEKRENINCNELIDKLNIIKDILTYIYAQVKRMKK